MTARRLAAVATASAATTAVVVRDLAVPTGQVLATWLVLTGFFALLVRFADSEGVL